MKNSITWGNIVWRAAPLLIIIVLISYFAGGGWSAIPSALVAWGTILLAFATFSLVRHSKEQEDRRRQEEQAKERRDRDERFLNEIIEWAVENIKIGTPIESAVFVGAMDEEAERRLVLNSLASLRNDFRAMIAISLYVSKLGLTFGEKLQNSIAKLDEDLRRQESIAIKCHKIVMEKKLKEFDDAWKELTDNWATLSNSAVNVIDEAVIEKFTILDT